MGHIRHLRDVNAREVKGSETGAANKHIGHIRYRRSINAYEVKRFKA